MKKLLETLYILTPDSYIYHRNENICISIGGEEKASIPISQVSSVIVFGKNTMSTSLLGFCSKHDVAISFLDRYGFFEGRLCGPVSGNVLLRKAQYERIEDPTFLRTFSRDLICCKIQNSKTMLLRYARNTDDAQSKDHLLDSAKKLCSIAENILESHEVNAMRGMEGTAAALYFSSFDHMLKNSDGFRFESRSRRPPKNEVNAVLSFLYTQLAHDYRSSMECVGLDPAAGFMHTLRPGRSSLALDLMEELRSPLCDRLTLTLFNKKQLHKSDFEYIQPAVYLNEKGRRTVLDQWRNRRQEEIRHPFLNEKIMIGLIPYVQSMLLARVLRGDLDRYPPFVWR